MGNTQHRSSYVFSVVSQTVLPKIVCFWLTFVDITLKLGPTVCVCCHCIVGFSSKSSSGLLSTSRKSFLCWQWEHPGRQFLAAAVCHGTNEQLSSKRNDKCRVSFSWRRWYSAAKHCADVLDSYADNISSCTGTKRIPQQSLSWSQCECTLSLSSWVLAQLAEPVCLCVCVLTRMSLSHNCCM